MLRLLGEKIKSIRKERKLTAKEVAERAEVTPGYISQIERDLISPSLSVLMRIAEALDTPLSSLVAQDATGKVMVIRKDKRTRIRFADINTEYEFVTPYSRNNAVCTKMEIICAKIGPKSWGSTTIQRHEEADECTLVLKGTLEYHVGETVHRLEAGDSIYVPPQTPHQLYNPGDEEAEIVACISPACY